MQKYPLHHWTPTFHSRTLSLHTGKTIYLKMECMQPVGSYKIRGIGRLCQHYAEKGIKHFVSSSGGNAGYAVAYVGRKLGIETQVFVPSNTHKIYIDLIRLQGANVKIAGKVWDEANNAAKAYVEEVGGALIPPFDHPLIWAGHSTMIEEVADMGIKPEAVVLAVGGGGLACGVIQGMQRQGWDDIPIYAIETEGAASFAAAFKAKKHVALDSINTLATTLGAKRICKQLFEYSQTYPISPITVTDHQAVLACQKFLNNHRMLIEPASGAALSVIYDQHQELQQHKSILVIVCGGIGISYELMHQFLDKTA